MSVPPLLRVNYKFYPLGKKRSKCRRIPPFRKRQMFSRDQRYRHSYPLRNDFKNPLPLPRISLTLNRGGADIKWNGPIQDGGSSFGARQHAAACPECSPTFDHPFSKNVTNRPSGSGGSQGLRRFTRGPNSSGTF